MASLGGGGVNCTICEKTAFPAETVSFEKKPYHIECFRCQEVKGDATCDKKLETSAANYYEEKLYCKQCFAAGGYSQKQRNVKWVPKTSSGGAAGPPSRFGGGGNPCTVCTKTVYPAEAISYEKKIYHADCFKCKTCEKKVTGAAAAAYDGDIYCKKCFSDGGFAQKQRNVKWTAKESSGSAGPSKFGGGGISCEICAKTVYPAEQISYEKKAFHSECFKCTTCSKKCTPSDAASYEAAIYCKKCFHDGGFTAKQRNVKWEAKETTGSYNSKFGGGGNKCAVCDKTVYPAETVAYEKKAYHQECFKCTVCGKKNTPSSCGKFEEDGVEKLFCTKCFGDGGYAKKQAAVKKVDGDAPAKSYDNRFAKFGGGGNKCVNCDKTVYPAEQLSFEKNVFHIQCFKCSHDGCSKGGKPITVSDAQYQKHDDGKITVFCNKCFGELGLNRA